MRPAERLSPRNRKKDSRLRHFTAYLRRRRGVGPFTAACAYAGELAPDIKMTQYLLGVDGVTKTLFDRPPHASIASETSTLNPVGVWVGCSRAFFTRRGTTSLL